MEIVLNQTSNKIIKMGDVFSNFKHYKNGRGSIYSLDGICATLVTMIGGQLPICIDRNERGTKR